MDEGVAEDQAEMLRSLRRELDQCRFQLAERQKRSAANENALLYADLQGWEARFRLAIDTIPGLAWFCRADGWAEFLNKQWRDYTGLSGDQALGWNWAQAIHPDDLPGLDRRIHECLRSPRPAEYEGRIRRFDGEYRWFLFRWAPLLDESGAVVRWYGTNTDIEERKRTEQVIRASEQLSRGQVEVLNHTLDALATESVPDRLVGPILRTITEQFGAHSSSVWGRDHASGLIGLEFAFESGRVMTKADPKFAGMDLWLPMEDLLPWPEVFRTGKPSLIEDIRAVPPFPLRDRLLPMGVVTVLLIPMFVAGRLEGAIGLRFIKKRRFRPEEMDLAQALANQAMLMIQFTRLSEQSREAAVTAERNRIARDIHDTLAQGFTGVIVQLEASEDARARGFSSEADEHLERARALARESLNEARRSVQALRPQALEDRSLSDAMENLFRKATRGTGLKSEFVVLGQQQELPQDWEENLFRISQELLTNTIRHAQASHFAARLIFVPGSVRLEMRDDGQGFDPSRKSDGFGLLGIRERVEGMGGQLTVRSAAGDGTAVQIALPLAEPSKVYD
jgi:PAS domain S-box-containing protein